MSVNKNRFNILIREGDDVNRLGLRVKYLCLSLMCEYHEHLHGELLGFEKTKEIYSLEVVPKDCRCGITQVLVDECRQPKDASLVDRVRLQAHKTSS
jgi:hypothetical protein